MKKTTTTLLTTEDKAFSVELIVYFSKYTKIVRMVAWMYRFCHNAKKHGTKLVGDLLTEELEHAEHALYHVIQAEWPKEDQGKVKTSLQLYTDTDGLLHLQTQLVMGEDPADFKRPVVLPDHPLVRKKIEHVHKSVCHAGVQTTLNMLRTHLWVLRGRRVVREITSKCTVCKRFSAKEAQTKTAPLPKERITVTSSFEVCGIDLSGPLIIKDNSKCWIVLFTCAVFRAVHLELVSSLSTEALLMAFNCSIIYCDNGTNLRGLATLLRSVSSNLEDIAEIKRIKFKFQPPAWWGGFFERMVGLVKTLLRKNLGRVSVTLEEMSTLLCEVESIVNQRPLTYMYDTPTELTPLMPMHFLTDSTSHGTEELNVAEGVSMVKRLRYLQELRERLRKRFHDEYIANLVSGPKAGSRTPLQAGDIVLVGMDHIKRVMWPLGRILELYPGKDGVERVARVKLQHGELIRPVQRLFALEISQPLADESVSMGNGIPTDIEAGIQVEIDNEADDTESVYVLDKKENSEKAVRTQRGRTVKPPLKLDL